MSNQQIAVTPKDDLVTIVANAPKNSELILASGKYILNRPLVVDKTIVMRSQTGKADDVMIGRNNATVLIVTDGKPTFHGILFFAPAKSDDAPIENTKYDFIEYKSAVAVRQKGNATFIGCKASSRQKSGFSARGKKARITLDKCWVFKTGEGGIFVDEQACGLVKDSLIQDAGLGCVDAESKGSVLTVENSTLARSGYASISPHDEGLVVVRNCKIDVGETYGAAIVNNGRLDVKGSQFFSELNDDTTVRTDARYGVYVRSGFAKITDCVMSKLIIGVFMEGRDARIKLKRVEMKEGMLTSLVYSDESPTVKISNCNFAEPSLELNDFVRAMRGLVTGSAVAKWNPNNFSDEQNNRAYDLKTQYYEKILGKEFPLVGHSETPFHEGGQLDLYYYTKSRYGGTFLLTKELVSPEFSHPSFEGVDAYELAIATRDPFYLDESGNSVPGNDDLATPYQRFYMCLCEAAQYIWEECSVARYYTLEIPLVLLNHYFIFDLIDDPETIEVGADSRDALDAYALESPTSRQSDQILSLDEALQTYAVSEEEKGNENRESTKRRFGVLVMIEIFESELKYLREHKGSSKEFLAKLKEQNHWPFSDMKRKPIF